MVEGLPAPSANDEYLLYQTLTGTWPLEPIDERVLSSYRDRIVRYMLKAINEAKIHSSWVNPNAAYQNATRDFVTAALSSPERNAFLADFVAFQRQVVEFGLLNGLSQTLLKLTVPGVADVYQGNEMWTFRLADPDNRSPVDHAAAAGALEALQRACGASNGRRALLAELVASIVDGRAKLYLTWRALQLRRAHPGLFAGGDYRALGATGARAEHICAFARSRRSDQVIVAAPRWFARLAASGKAPVDPDAWVDTWVRCPGETAGETYRNVLSDETVSVVQRDAGLWFPAADLFRHFPVALLSRH